MRDSGPSFPASLPDSFKLRSRAGADLHLSLPCVGTTRAFPGLTRVGTTRISSLLTPSTRASLLLTQCRYDTDSSMFRACVGTTRNSHLCPCVGTTRTSLACPRVGTTRISSLLTSVSSRHVLLPFSSSGAGPAAVSPAIRSKLLGPVEDDLLRRVPGRFCCPTSWDQNRFHIPFSDRR